MDQPTMIDQIVAIEWGMFSKVANMGGPAACQEDLTTFAIMRRSQAQTWSLELQASYLDDLRAARRNGINLMTVKYARMMETTHPAEYARFKDELPPIDDEARRLVDEIAAVHRSWDREMIARYPHLRDRGRPASTSDDTPYATSAETYLRGELLTYSPRSIALYHLQVMLAKDAGVNLAEQTLLNMVRSYGYASLDDAEKNLAVASSTI